MAKEVGAYTLLDASQSLGHVPVDVPTLAADLVAFTGHKGLRGPPGCGGLYITRELELAQVIVGGTGVRSDLLLHPHDMPVRLESGTPNLPAIAGLLSALQWLEEHKDAFAAKELHLCEILKLGLSKFSKVRLFEAPMGEKHTPLISFVVDGWDVEESGQVLEESFGIVSRAGLHCAPLMHAAIGSAPKGTVRFSPSGYNSENEIEQVLWSVGKLAS